MIKIGNSLGIIIPKKLIKSLGWKAGTILVVTINYEDGTISLKKKSKIFLSEQTKELVS